MRQADQPPFATHVRQAPEEKSAETARFLALAEHRLHHDLAPGLQRLPSRRPHCRGQALLSRGGRLRDVRRRSMGPLAGRRTGRIAPSRLPRLHGRLTVIALVQGRRKGL